MITICKYYIKSKIRCQYTVPCWPLILSESKVVSAPSNASWGNLILKMQHNTSKQAKQKISANLDHHSSKKCSFLCVQTNWVCPSGTQRFCKNDFVSSHWLWLESSHSVKNVTRVESSHHFSQRDSSRAIDSSHAITTSQQPTTLYGTAASHASCCLIGTWSTWSWRWLAIAAFPLQPEMAKAAGYNASRMVSHRNLSWRPFSSTSTSLTCQPPSPESMHMLTT